MFTLALLFKGSGSVPLNLALTLFSKTVSLTATLAVIVKILDSPLAKSIFHETVLSAITPLVTTLVKPFGKTSTTLMFLMSSGPLLLTVIVQTTVSPITTTFLSTLMSTAMSALGKTVTVALELLERPLVPL